VHWTQADVVAVKGCVESADRHVNSLKRFYGASESLSNRRTARVHPDQYNIAGALIPLDNLVSDAGMRSAKIVGGEDACS
jgi:hypothetical protein